MFSHILLWTFLLCIHIRKSVSAALCFYTHHIQLFGKWMFSTSEDQVSWVIWHWNNGREKKLFKAIGMDLIASYTFGSDCLVNRSLHKNCMLRLKCNVHLPSFSNPFSSALETTGALKGPYENLHVNERCKSKVWMEPK